MLTPNAVFTLRRLEGQEQPAGLSSMTGTFCSDELLYLFVQNTDCQGLVIASCGALRVSAVSFVSFLQVDSGSTVLPREKRDTAYHSLAAAWLWLV